MFPSNTIRLNFFPIQNLVSCTIMNLFIANAHLHDPTVDITKVKLVELGLPVVLYILKIPRWEVEFAMLSYSSYQSHATLRVKKKSIVVLVDVNHLHPLMKATQKFKVQGSVVLSRLQNR